MEGDAMYTRSREFDAYAQFVTSIWKYRKRPIRVLLEMPTYVREMCAGDRSPLTRDELASLLQRFAKEFRSVF